MYRIGHQWEINVQYSHSQVMKGGFECQLISQGPSWINLLTQRRRNRIGF